MKFPTTLTASLLGLSLAAGPAGADILFNPNGTGLPGAKQISLFDWAPDNALFQGVVEATPRDPPAPGLPVIDPGFKEGKLLIQGRLTSSDASFVPVGAEITFQSSIPIALFGADPVGGFRFTSDTFIDEGEFKIWYDAAEDSDQITGLGYDNGTLILEGTTRNTADVGILVFNEGVGTEELDQFGINNKPLVTTVEIFGSGPTHLIDIDDFDLLFFPADANGNTIDVDGEEDLKLIIDATAPFLASNPSSMVVGETPDYGSGAGSNINDALCGSATVCDVHAESDTRSPFSADLRLVPAPGPLALVGLGLVAAAGFRGRRRS